MGGGIFCRFNVSHIKWWSVVDTSHYGVQMCMCFGSLFVIIDVAIIDVVVSVSRVSVTQISTDKVCEMSNGNLCGISHNSLSTVPRLINPLRSCFVIRAQKI